MTADRRVVSSMTVRVGVVPQSGGYLLHLVLLLTSLILVKSRRCLVTTTEDQVNKTRSVMIKRAIEAFALRVIN